MKIIKQLLNIHKKESLFIIVGDDKHEPTTQYLQNISKNFEKIYPKKEIIVMPYYITVSHVYTKDEIKKEKISIKINGEDITSMVNGVILK